MDASSPSCIRGKWRLDGTIKLIQSEVDRVKPTRVVFDSLSELRLLAQDSLRYRRQVLALKQFFAPRNITVFLVDDLTGENGERDAHLHSLCHGVISLERMTLDFGAARRRMQVQKLRGVDFIAGYHDITITTGGMRIFPRLIASDHHVPFIGDAVSSGVARIDALLHGGPLRGTSTLLTGPAGSGKTNIALQYVTAACERGEHCCILEFDERTGTLLTRAESLGMDLRKYLDAGLLELHQMDPAELTPGEFAWAVRASVEQRNCRVLVIDSLNGYLTSMPQEKQLMLQMHEPAVLPQPERRDHVPGQSAARLGRHDVHRQPQHLLHGRHRHPVPLLRGAGAHPQGLVGDQEPQWRARGFDPRACASGRAVSI